MKKGFTLIELLIVLVIISLLAGITTTVFIGARKSVNSAMVMTQLTQLSMALDAYKSRFGEYPPDFSDQTAVLRHIRKRWPRYKLVGSNDAAKYATFCLHIRCGSQLSATVDLAKSTGAVNHSFSLTNTFKYWDFENAFSPYLSPLIFWLGGLPDKEGVPCGFFLNPKAPLGFEGNDTTCVWTNVNITTLQREENFFKFDLKILDELPISTTDKSVVPVLTYGKKPILYFKAWNNTTGQGGYANPTATAQIKYYDFTSASTNPEVQELGIAVPYARSNMAWYEAERFQLVHPGMDGCFGDATRRNPTMAVHPTDGANMTLEDNDNVTNFISNGSVLENEKQ